MFYPATFTQFNFEIRGSVYGFGGEEVVFQTKRGIPNLEHQKRTLYPLQQPHNLKIKVAWSQELSFKEEVSFFSVVSFDKTNLTNRKPETTNKGQRYQLYV